MANALLATSSFLPGRGGIETYLAELCLELSPNITVFAPAERDGMAIPHHLPYPTEGYEGSLLFPSDRIVAAIEAAAESAGTDRVLLGTPWPLALLGPRLRRAGLRYAVIVHGAEIMVPGAVPYLRSRLSQALAEADLLLPVSAFTMSKVTKLIGKRRLPPVEILRARVDTDRFRPGIDAVGIDNKYGLAGRQVILVLGRLVRRKGVHRLIRVFPNIAHHHPDVCLVIAGTGPQEKTLRQDGAVLGEQIVFTGRVSDADAPALYAAADVFALPVADRWWGLDAEGLGVVLLEASACGVPCVTGRSGGTPEAVVDGKTGFVVDAQDEEQLVGSISKLLSQPDLAREMGVAGRRHVVAEFAERSLPGALLEWLFGA